MYLMNNGTRGTVKAGRGSKVGAQRPSWTLVLASELVGGDVTRAAAVLAVARDAAAQARLDAAAAAPVALGRVAALAACPRHPLPARAIA